jgi:hypothetical protein
MERPFNAVTVPSSRSRGLRELLRASLVGAQTKLIQRHFMLADGIMVVADTLANIFKPMEWREHGANSLHHPMRSLHL